MAGDELLGNQILSHSPNQHLVGADAEVEILACPTSSRFTSDADCNVLVAPFDSIGQCSNDVIRAADVVIMPIGFICDHMEIVFDLDTEAQKVANERGINLVRAATVGTHPRFVAMIRDLIVERIEKGPEWSVCADDCCPAPVRPLRPRA